MVHLVPEVSALVDGDDVVNVRSCSQQAAIQATVTGRLIIAPRWTCTTERESPSESSGVSRPLGSVPAFMSSPPARVQCGLALFAVLFAESLMAEIWASWGVAWALEAIRHDSSASRR